MRVIRSIDGSKEGAAARGWCLQHLEPGDEVIAIVGRDQFTELILSMSPLLGLVDDAHIADDAARRFEAPLERHGITCRTRIVTHGQARAVADTAAAEHAGLVVVGKRPHNRSSTVAVEHVHRPACREGMTAR
jgi:hypothetical protein